MLCHRIQCYSHNAIYSLANEIFTIPLHKKINLRSTHELIIEFYNSEVKEMSTSNRHTILLSTLSYFNFIN